MNMNETSRLSTQPSRQPHRRGGTVVRGAMQRLALLAIGLATGAMAAYAAQGDLDVSFGAAGKGRVLDSFNGAAPLALASVIQADGKTVVAGSARNSGQFFVARYNLDGSADTSFSSDGVTGVSFTNGPGAAYALLQQPDGKLVVTGAGQNNRAGDYDIVAVRLNADGSADTSFGTSGIAQFKDGGFDEFAAGIVRQADGKLLVAGTSNNNRGGYDFTFVRFNADGSVDTTFGSNGRLFVDFNGNDDQANALIAQSDGAVVAVGFARDSAGFSSMAAVRLTAAGVLDTTFGTNGKLSIPYSLQSTANAIAQQSDGKLVIAGAVAESTTSTDSTIVRLAANGALDTSFGTGGKATFSLGGKDYFSSVLIDPSGRLLVAGRMQRSTPPPTDGVVLRLSSTGTLDTTFGIDGKTQIDCGDLTSISNCAAYSLSRQSDGKLITIGYDDTQQRMFIARLLASGGYAGNVGFVTTSEALAESLGSRAITLRRSGGRVGAVSVAYTVTPGTALQGSDITFTNGTVSWADGDSADKTISIGIVDDTLVEFSEGFSIELSNPTGGAGLAASQYIAAITDNDTATNGALQFTTTAGSIGEAAGSATLTVGRPGGATGAVSVSYATADGTATSASDYTSTTGTLSWADGDSTSKTITVPVTNDTTAESDETLTITLSSPTGGAILGANARVTLTIVDNDGPGVIGLFTATQSVLESGTSATLTVSRTVGTKGAVSVDYTTTAGSATAGSDYTTTSGTLTWADADVADKTITVPVIDDAAPEGAETFTVNLSNPGGGATLSTIPTTTVTITANDAPGTLQFAATTLSVAEDAGNATLSVTRSAGATGPASVQYQASSGTATSGSDFTATSGTLNWADGDFAAKTISVPITNDTDTEADETLVVSLFNPTGSGGLDNNSAATVTILANDSDTSGGGGGGKSGCFIATAAFGTPMAGEVMELRHFRDGYLLQRDWGRSFVKFYYAHSPPIADFIRDRDWLRSIVRVALRPLIWMAERINGDTAPQSPRPGTQQPTQAAVLPGRRTLDLTEA